MLLRIFENIFEIQLYSGVRLVHTKLVSTHLYINVRLFVRTKLHISILNQSGCCKCWDEKDNFNLILIILALKYVLAGVSSREFHYYSMAHDGMA